MNAGKTKFMCYEQDSQIQSLRSLEGKSLECVTDFEYLSLWISTTSRDIASQKAKTWPALCKLDNIWKSNLPRWLKMWFFRAVVASILLYGAECWTLTKSHESQLYGTYMWMLHFALNVHWSQHVTNEQLYGNLPHLSAPIRLCHMKFVGHCCWAKEEPVSKVLFWTPHPGRRRHGRLALSYPKLLENDRGMMVGDIQSTMKERDLWQQCVCRRLERRLDR